MTARHEQIAEQIRAHLHADALRAVADPSDPFTAEDVTSWRIVVEIESAEVDDETGEEVCSERITATAYDNGHHSNVLFIELTEDGIEVE